MFPIKASLIGFFCIAAVMSLQRIRTVNLLRSIGSKLNSTTSTGSDNIKRYILEYSYVKDILEKRGPYREKHLELLNALVKDGKLLGAGPWSPPTGAIFIFKANNVAGKEAAEQFVKDDPYVSAGLVTSYNIKEWTKVIGIDSL